MAVPCAHPVVTTKQSCTSPVHVDYASPAKAMASLDEPKKRRKKKNSVDSPSNGSPKASSKASKRRDSRLSSGGRHSPFPSGDMDAVLLRKKCDDYEQKIKSLMRDNKVLAKKIDKIESASKSKNKKIENETEMRLRANRDRYALKQKLDRLQK